jgi:hypothetical protein
MESKVAIISGKTDGYVTIPVTNPTEGTIAALHILLNHTADVFHAIVGAVSEHYKLDKDEMMTVILKHPKYTGVSVNPVLQDMGYLYKEIAPAARLPAEVIDAPKTKFKIRAKKVGASE